MGSRPRRNVLIGALIIVALVAVSWFLVLGPRLATTTVLAEQTAQTESATIAQMNKLHRLQDKARDVPAAARRVQRLLSRMPQEADLSALLTQLSAAAERADIPADQIIAVTPSVPVPLEEPGQRGSASGPVLDAEQSDQRKGVQVASLDLAMSVLATPKQLRGFLRNIEQLDRDMLVTSIATSADPTSQRKDVQLAAITMTTFVLQSQLPDLEEDVRRALADLPMGKSVG